jgi:hypothetical protein
MGRSPLHGPKKTKIENTMKQILYRLTHDFETPESPDNGRVIGFYSTHAKAEAALKRISKYSGFSEYPDGFVIGECVVDQDHWTSGFITYTGQW